MLSESLKVDDKSKLKIEEEVLRLMVQALDCATDVAENEDQDPYDKEKSNQDFGKDTFPSSDGDEIFISFLDKLRLEQKISNFQQVSTSNPEQKLALNLLSLLSVNFG